MGNREVADVLNELADLLEIQGADPFRVRAYRRAAQEVERLPVRVQDLAAKDQLESIPGVGADLAGKIREYLETGRLGFLEEQRAKVPPGLVDLMRLPGLGPRRAATLGRELGVRGLADLERAVSEHKVRGLRGFGPKLEENLARELERRAARTARMPLAVALPAAEEVVGLLRRCPQASHVEVAGSIRRMKETVGDIDILAATSDPEAVIDAFTSLPLVRDVLSRGPRRGSIVTAEGVQIDVRIVEPEAWGAALQYFTGSKAHNIKLRGIAIRKGLKLNEYGVFEEASGRRVAGATEESVYAALDLPWMPPEIREDWGEVEAAQRGELPDLLLPEQVRGDLHVHTVASDGSATVEAMAAAARRCGYAYVAISDHSEGLRVARGLSVERLREQVGQIRRLNQRLRGFRVLTGAEVDIRPDGTLDYPDEVLAELDVVTASVHSAFSQSPQEMTARLIRAVEHPHVHVLGHPHGRLIGKREGYAFDEDAVFRAAARAGTALEINAQPDRLDLNDESIRRARRHGAKFVINTDAHSTGQFALMRYGVATARRGWLEAADVLNTRPLADLLAWLHESHAAARPG